MLLTAQDAAYLLKLDASSVRRLAAMHGIGKKFGPVWTFTARDIERLEKRPGMGRPFKKGKR